MHFRYTLKCVCLVGRVRLSSAWRGQVNSLANRFTSKNWGMEGACHSCDIYEIWSSKDVGEM